MAYPENPKYSNEVTSLLAPMEPITRGKEVKFFLSDAKTCYRVAKPHYSISHGKSLFVGNEHRLIVDFVTIVQEIHKPSLPLTIVNFDLHIDDSPYKTNPIQPQSLNASWQRYIVDIGLTTPEQSYNLYPPDEDVMQLSAHTQEIAFPHSRSLLSALPSLDILSVDLDYFNSVKSDHQLHQVLTILKGYSTKATTTLFFTSPATSLHLFSPLIVSSILATRS